MRGFWNGVDQAGDRDIEAIVDPNAAADGIAVAEQAACRLPR